MTLQRFVVAYIFQPLSLPLTRIAAAWGLSRWTGFLLDTGLPIFITFVILGLWHGAGWTFVLFGAAHGIYLGVNEAWRMYQGGRRRNLKRARAPASIVQALGRGRLPPHDPRRRNLCERHVPSCNPWRRRPDLVQHDRIRERANAGGGGVRPRPRCRASRGGRPGVSHAQLATNHGTLRSGVELA